ncbi:hypothetical protein [Eubacterium sp.]|uniref:hypothetical protein n=1 Tax=Eubacterium sp. TaxID=142586 RepID=UPI001EBB558D|nr:hypothetical protein [Eubacterium sp.]MBS5275605.1 hypothetical protein [Clostridiales bacterium]MDD7331338.1 hypothetical protein [Eubacterium sp.]MDY5242728.1 hypothetical protein [Eubacterium sp.]
MNFTNLLFKSTEKGMRKTARRKKTLQEQIEQGLLDIALGSVSDAISLLFMTEEEIIERLPKLKLINVSEIKRPKGGGMEIKFFDRIKALERLGTDKISDSDSSLSFYEALEKSANDSREKSDD